MNIRLSVVCLLFKLITFFMYSNIFRAIVTKVYLCYVNKTKWQRTQKTNRKELGYSWVNVAKNLPKISVHLLKRVHTPLCFFSTDVLAKKFTNRNIRGNDDLSKYCRKIGSTVNFFHFHVLTIWTSSRITKLSCSLVYFLCRALSHPPHTPYLCVCKQ